MNNQANAVKNLIAHEIPLIGKHLIEASAGTGKTFNITRIYLRLLLEKNLPVEQILVMTFTKDATEELRGRIDSFIREALNNWPSLIESDDYFKAIAEKITPQQVQQRLRQALLFLDEAAIFTIHGFCKRVLSQYAFDSGLSFNMQMESNCQELLVESCQDFYRILAKQHPEQFLQLAAFWSHPLSFLKHFSKAIHKRCDIEIIPPAAIKAQLIYSVQQAIADLNANTDFLTIHLIDKKKGAEREGRVQELAQLIHWLEQLLATLIANEADDNFTLDTSDMPDSFTDARRYSRAKEKETLLEIFNYVKKAKQQVQSFNSNINKAHAFTIVREGIYQIRQRFEDKKQQKNILSFDDLISTFAQKLKESASFAQKVFQQYPVALVDEFQDTDPEQFAILSAIYDQQPSAAIYMIGDPKQAIYGFRGGDVFAYLAAREDCDQQWIMDTNWRSSPEMITGYNRLFYGESLVESSTENPKNNEGVFGYGIPYVPVKSAPNASEKSSQYNGSKQALHFVHFDSDDSKYVTVRKSDGVKKVKQSYREVMAAWCAQEIVTLLSDTGSDQSQCQNHNHNQDQKLASQDIAILVRDGSEAADIKAALTDRNLASVFMSNRANLLKSEQSHQLLSLLTGILFVENERLYTAALSSSLLGITPTELYQLQQDELAWQQKRSDFIALRELWLSKGFITMALTLMHDQFQINHQDKDRILTNLLHLFEVLQSASQRYSQPQELVYWFEHQIQSDNPEVEAELRLESDDNLIRIITQHGSKGLEYPIVFVPFASRHKDPLKLGASSHIVLEHHDQQKQLHITLDGADVEEIQVAKQAMADEVYAETIRLLYVAVTRAEQRCYMLTTEFEYWQNSPLGKTLQATSDRTLLSELQKLQAEHPDSINVSQISDDFDVVDYAQQAVVTQTPQVERFTGKIERDWWLSSFSSLSRNLRSHGVSSPDRDENTVASFSENLLTTNNDALLDESYESNELRFRLEKGAHSGNLLHNILEHCDFTAPNWPELIEKPLTYYGELPEGFDESDLIKWLNQIVNAPLAGSSSADNHQSGNDGFALADISLAKSLREIEFYYPMENSQVRDLTNLLTDHRNSLPYENTEQAFHSRRVILPNFQKLKGMMHGFVDLIFEHQGKFYIADHKSTHLGEHYQDYSISAMRECIEHHYYDLQYLIYSLALHRYLALSLPDYDPAKHFGGVYYFFLRGMTDSNSEHMSTGVYFREIMAQELTQLDELFSFSLANNTAQSA